MPARLLISLLLFSYSLVATAADNVILITIDDLRVDNQILTPNLDALANSGTRYTSAYATGTYCLTSRTGMVMGMHTEALGNVHPWFYPISSAYADIYLNPSITSLPEVMSDAGYTTAVAGKVFHTRDTSRWDVNGPETDYFQLMTPGPGPYGTWIPEPAIGVPHDQTVADWAGNFLQTAQEPFFLAVGLYQPHVPYVIPVIDYQNVNAYIPDPNDLDDIPAKGIDLIDSDVYGAVVTWNKADLYTRAYMSAASYTDTMVGQVLNALDLSGKDAHVIVVSDHGYHMGEKSHWRKMTFWEQTLRVPLVISSPDYPQGVVTEPVTLLDIAPTIFEMAGIPQNQVPAQFEGMPLLNSTTPVEAYWAHGKATIKEKAGDTWKFIDYDLDTPDLDDESAYNLSIDPMEVVNRIDEYRQLPGC